MGVLPIRCPHCHRRVSDTQAYCPHCTELLPRVRGGRRWGVPETRRKQPHEPLPTVLEPIPAAPPRTPFLTRSRIVFFLFGLTAVGLVLGWRMWVSHSRMDGSALGHRFFPYSTYAYLVNLKSKIEIWTERNGQLDQRLALNEWNDTGSLSVSTLSTTPKRQTLLIEPSEWFVSSTALSNDDPSLKPGTVLLNNEGTVVERSGAQTARVGKSLAFLLPNWPPGLQAKGASWLETVRWTEVLDSWTIQWDGRLEWTLLHVEPCAGSTCARLKYRAHLTPLVKEAPAWAKDQITGVTFTGETDGSALFDLQQNQLFSNSFSYHGSLRIALSNIERARPKRDPRIAPVHQPGAIVIQLKQLIHIGKS